MEIILYAKKSLNIRYLFLNITQKTQFSNVPEIKKTFSDFQV